MTPREKVWARAWGLREPDVELLAWASDVKIHDPTKPIHRLGTSLRKALKELERHERKASK